ncbi:MAG: LysR family transcriptional regulator [Deltaproteobacteria bacterium]|nr:LysR family transcriptional regulator [Deltaproteobacteria bacterium]
MKLTDLQTFLRVAETGTFADAARALRVPKSTVTRRVERLEADLGQALLVRSARAIRLSEAGRFVHDQASTSIAELDSLEQRVREQAGEVTGTLKITLPTDLAGTAEFAALVEDYQARHPRVRVHVVATERVIDIVEEGFDVAIRPRVILRPADASLQSRTIADVRIALYASRAFVKARGGLQHIQTLEPDQLLAQAGASRVADGPLAEALARGTPRVVSTDFGSILALVTCGTGIGMLPSYLVEGRDDLIEVLPELGKRVFPLVMLWPASRHIAARLRAFLDLVAERPRFASSRVPRQRAQPMATSIARPAKSAGT